MSKRESGLVVGVDQAAISKSKARPSRRKRDRIRRNRKRERRVQRALAGEVVTVESAQVRRSVDSIENRTIIDQSLRWFVVRTFPGYEHRVSVWLRGQGIPFYLPADEIVRVKRGKPYTLTRYALPRHLFVGVDKGPGAIDIHDLVKDPSGFNVQGVYDVMHLYGRTVEVSASDLQLFSDTLAVDIGSRTMPEVRNIRNGDQVLIISGPFAQFCATVSGPAGGGKIQAEVPIFGRSVLVDLGLDQIAAA